MCDPVTIAMGASIGMSAFGSYQAGRAQAKAHTHAAAAAMQRAYHERQVAERLEARQRRQNERQMGGLRARQGSRGIAIEGSPEEVLAQAAGDTELDALDVRYQGALRANTYLQQAAELEHQARQTKRQNRDQLLIGLADGFGGLGAGALMQSLNSPKVLSKSRAPTLYKDAGNYGYSGSESA